MNASDVTNSLLPRKTLCCAFALCITLAVSDYYKGEIKISNVSYAFFLFVFLNGDIP